MFIFAFSVLFDQTYQKFTYFINFFKAAALGVADSLYDFYFITFSWLKHFLSSILILFYLSLPEGSMLNYSTKSMYMKFSL